MNKLPDKFVSSIGKSKDLLVWIALIVSWLWFLWLGYSYSTEEGYVYVTVLFALPLAVQALVLLRLKGTTELCGVYALAMIVGIWSYLYYWGVYLSRSWTTATWLVPVIIASVLVCGALLMTWVMMQRERPGSPHRVHKLIGQASEHRFPSLCFFLGVFLCVTYLLTFAVALHDKSKQDLALYQALLNFANRKAVAEDYPSAALFFGEGSAVLEVNTRDEGDPTWAEKVRPELKESAHLASRNSKSLKALLKGMQQFQEYERIRITVMGHTNPKDIRETATRYRSNWELSLARAQEVGHVLSRILEIDGRARGSAYADYRSETKDRVWRNIEWRLYPASDEKVHLVDGLLKKSATPEIKDLSLSAEVSVEPVRGHPSQLQLEAVTPRAGKGLIDYVYFTIYTITTTGYGDIIPLTAEAKFIVSVANLFEVIFLVIFFNAVLSGRRQIQGEGEG